MISRSFLLHICILLLACTGLSGDTTQYSYDDAGRLIQVVYPNGKTITYTYDNAGNLLSRQISSRSGQSAKNSQKEKPARKSEPPKEQKHAQ